MQKFMKQIWRITALCAVVAAVMIGCKQTSGGGAPDVPKNPTPTPNRNTEGGYII